MKFELFKVKFGYGITRLVKDQTTFLDKALVLERDVKVIGSSE